jgi:hypothetical protein
MFINNYQIFNNNNNNNSGVNLTTRLHLLSTSVTVELYLHSSMRLHGAVLNYAQRQLYLCLTTTTTTKTTTTAAAAAAATTTTTNYFTTEHQRLSCHGHVLSLV